MKKIFIASACAFSLCLTSCASKQAPEEPQNQAPQTDLSEVTQATKETDSTSETAAQEIDELSETESSQENAVESEEYPEPESLEEPEIITLEPVEEIIISAEEEPQAEQVTEEEPPVIEETPVLVQEETTEPEIVETPEVKTEVTENKKNSNSTNKSKNIYSDVDDVISIGGGIDTTYEESDSTEEDSGDDIVITPSRSVTMKKFEYLDVTYPGTGWIYMGLTDDSKDLANFGRKLGTKDTKFTLQARNAGTKIAHFYKNDPLSGHYLDDYIEIIILPETGSNKTHIEAPEYKLPVQKIEEPSADTEEIEEPSADTEETEETDENQQTEKTTEVKTDTQTVTQTSSNTSKKTSSDAAKSTASNAEVSTASNQSATQASETAQTGTTQTSAQTSETQTTITTTTATTPSTLLQEAQLLYNEKEYAAALAKLNQFFEYSTDNRDEALYLKGQILEAKSEVRDIKGAMDAYTSLTKNYPASKLWDSANKRIIYLKRFYLEVR